MSVDTPRKKTQVATPRKDTPRKSPEESLTRNGEEALTPGRTKTAVALEKFVYHALEEQRKSPSKNYQTLISQLQGQIDAPGLYRWYAALSKCASLVNSDPRGAFRSLVAAIFACDYKLAPPETARTYLHFLLNLATVNSGFMKPCLRVVVKSFTIDALEEEAGRVTLEDLHDMVHSTLSRLLKLSPSSTSFLLSVMLECFPHQRHSITVQQMYVKNLLRVSEYAPSLRNWILTKIIERLIHIDVEIIIEDKGKQASMEYARSKVDCAAGLQGEMAGKLDTLLFMLFRYLHLLAHTRFAQSTFTCLMDVFERSILKTHKARFTPFLLFVQCSTQHEFADAFLTRLKVRMEDPKNSLSERITCSAYIASFVSRAAQLRQVTVIHAFEFLRNVVINYIRAYDERCRQYGHHREWGTGEEEKVGLVEAGEHAVLYSMCQALFYVFARRQDVFLRVLEDNPQQVEEYGANFEEIVESPLNPIRFCLPSVVHEFSQIVLRLEILDCRAILRENAGLMRVEAHGNKMHTNVRDFEMGKVLETIFPFDPYLLPTSAEFAMEEHIYLHHIPKDARSLTPSPRRVPASFASPVNSPISPGPDTSFRSHGDYATPLLSPFTLPTTAAPLSPNLESFSITPAATAPMTIPRRVTSSRLSTARRRRPARSRSPSVRVGSYASDDDAHSVAFSFSDMSFNDSPALASHSYSHTSHYLLPKHMATHSSSSMRTDTGTATPAPISLGPSAFFS